MKINRLLLNRLRQKCFLDLCEKTIPVSSRWIEVHEKKNRPPDLLLEFIYKCPKCLRQEKKYQRVEKNQIRDSKLIDDLNKKYFEIDHA